MKHLSFNEEKREGRADWPMNEPEFKDCNTLRIEVRYSAGGMNWMSGERNKRGYRVSITPANIGNGFFSCQIAIGGGRDRIGGGYIMIEEAARYNKKRLLELCTIMDERIPKIAAAYIADDTEALIALIHNDKAAPVTVTPKLPASPLAMKPLTQEVLDAFAKQGRCDGRPPEEVKIIAKFFMPDAQCSWYATEYDPAERLFFGWANLGDDQCAELGYFSLDELAKLRGKLGLPVERDRHFGEHTLKEVMTFAVR